VSHRERVISGRFFVIVGDFLQNASQKIHDSVESWLSQAKTPFLFPPIW
jgi:hypothetical protein